MERINTNVFIDYGIGNKAVFSQSYLEKSIVTDHGYKNLLERIDEICETLNKNMKDIFRPRAAGF
jgi:hypothetical protein